MDTDPDNGWFLCCVGGWRRIVCVLDNLNHAALRRHRIKLLCVVHDRAIGLTWKQARS